MRTILFSIVVSLFFNAGFAQKYWVQSNTSKSLDFNKTYKVAILPVFSNDMDLEADQQIKGVAYNNLSLQLNSTGKFMPVNKQIVEQAIQKYRYGGGSINANNYNDIATELGVDYLITCEINKDQGSAIKDFVPILVYVQMIDPKDGGIAVYSGKARAKSFLSRDAEIEKALENAMKELVQKSK